MSIETVKNYWDASPCNIRHSNYQIGTKEYFNQVEQKKYRAEPHILIFAEVEKWQNKEVLEIGCGIVTALISFLRSGATVTAFDLSEKSIEIARQRLKVFNFDADLYCCNAENFVLDEKFDLIYSFGVIHHTPNPKSIIKNMREMIKKEGEIRIMLYSFCSYKAFDVMHQTNNWSMTDMPKTIQNFSEAQEGCPISNIYTFEDVEELLAPYFKITKIWKQHIFIWDVEEYKKGNFVPSTPFKDIDPISLKKLEKELGWHTLCYAVPI